MSAALLLVVLAAGIGGRLPGQSVAPVRAVPEPEANPTTATPPPSASSSPRPNREVAPGLTRGTVRVQARSADVLHGVRVGFPRTLDGAVTAAITYDNAWHSPAMYATKTRQDLNRRLYTREGQSAAAMDDQLAAAFAKTLGLNAQGKVLTSKGKVDPSRKLIVAGYPRYGAYRIDRAQPSREAPQEVVVTSWRPFVLGTGPDRNRAKATLSWAENTVTVRWSGGDWRIASINANIKARKPADPTVPHQTFAARAKTLGPGWSVPADAVQNLVPGTVVP